MNPQYLHTMIRVRDLEKSVAFYRDCLGMTLHSRRDYPGGKFTLAFLGYGEAPADPQLELTYNWEQSEDYQLGEGYGHVAFAVENIYDFFAGLVSKGVEITRPAGPMKHGSTVIGFIKDPDGYPIEFIERKI